MFESLTKTELRKLRTRMEHAFGATMADREISDEMSDLWTDVGHELTVRDLGA